MGIWTIEIPPALKFYSLISSMLLWTPLLLAIFSVVRLFKNKLTFRVKLFIAVLMLIAGSIPLVRIPVDQAIAKHHKMLPPKLRVDMGYSENGGLFVVADSENDIPYKARWVICTKNNSDTGGIMLEDVIFYPTPTRQRMQYREDIDRNRVIDDYIELRFDYESIYAAEMGEPKGLSGKVTKKYKMSKYGETPALVDIPDSN